MKVQTMRSGVYCLYDSYMKEIAVSEARERLSEVIDQTRDSGEPAALTRRGRVVAILVAPDVFENLTREAEDAIDRAALDIDREEQDYIPWEQVKTELGLS